MTKVFKEISLSINERAMKLSQSPKTYLYLSFLLIFSLAISINLKSQSISTVGEIYDYDVGDIFHFKFTNGYAKLEFVRYTNIEIIDEYHSPNSDTICYTMSYSCKESDPFDTGWVYENYSSTRCYSQLDSLINGGDIDTSYNLPNYYNGRLINSLDQWSGPEQISHRFVNGCGLVSYNILDLVSHFYWRDNLVYYKKGFETWGIPVYISIEKRDIDKGKISIYPNPAIDYIKVKITNPENGFLEIFTITGQRIISIEPISESKRVDISELEKGMYILIITRDGDRIYRKLIKE